MFLEQASVAPGQIGTFRFDIQASPAPGTYNEYFNLVAEGRTWFNDIGQYFQIRVVKSVYSGAIHLNSYTANIANNSTAVATIKVLNNGNVTWYNDGAFPVRLGTFNPVDRNSSFKGQDWIAPSRPAALTAPVAPGQIGTFTFNVRSPNDPGAYSETFSLVADNLAWFNQPIVQTYNVSGVAVATKPVYRHYSPSRLVHFYTTDLEESMRIRSGGWNYEGIGWYVPTTATSKPIYRHYSPARLSHFFTASESESLNIRPYWNYEGIGWYASDNPTSTPIYRHYSPARGKHFFTASESESLMIRSQGWNYEGIAWYAFSQ